MFKTMRKRGLDVCQTTFFSCPLVSLCCQHSLDGWRKVFWLAAGISVFGSLFYSIFGSANLQPWAMTKEEIEEAERKRISSTSKQTIDMQSSNRSFQLFSKCCTTSKAHSASVQGRFNCETVTGPRERAGIVYYNVWTCLCNGCMLYSGEYYLVLKWCQDLIILSGLF